MIGKILLSVVVTFIIIFVVPFPFYAGLAYAGLVEHPEEASAATFVLGVLVSMMGTAIAFVLIFCVARSLFTTRWGTYAFLWWLMSVIHEVGQSIGPGYTWMEGIAGVASETVYFPLAGFVISRMLRPLSDSGLENPIGQEK